MTKRDALKQYVTLKSSLEAEKAKLTARLDELNRALSGAEASRRGGWKRKRKMSAAAKGRIAAAQKARWAKIKALKRGAA